MSYIYICVTNNVCVLPAATPLGAPAASSASQAEPVGTLPIYIYIIIIIIISVFRAQHIVLDNNTSINAETY